MSLQKQAIIAMSIETATRSGSLALLHDQNVCAQWEGGETTSHSSELLVEIEKLLSQTEFNLGDLDLLAGAIGPGSFTGLRVGLATLKGLATALQKPVCGVPTLEAMAFGHPGENTKITVLSAGRNEVYAQIWKLNKKNELVAETALKTIDLTSLLSKLDSNQVLDWIITKENYSTVSEFIEREKRTNWMIVMASQNLATNIAQIAQNRFNNRQIKSVEEETSVIYGRNADFGK